MKMKMMMIAALAAAPLPAAAAPAQGAEQPREESAALQPGAPDGAGAAPMERTQFADAQAPARAADAQEEEKPRKRKSTGDKVLTGAAVILGIGALAVGALLVAIAVN